MSVNVAILCGGFWNDIVQQILIGPRPGTSGTSTSAAVTARPREAATSSGLRRTVLHGPIGSERACPTLAPIFGRKAAEYLLRSLEGVRRLAPLSQHVYFVVNEVDRPLFESAQGSLFSEVSDLRFTSANVISNGARKPSEWRGELGDLHSALQTLGTSKPLVAISGAMCLLPGFNMQRIIEHSIIRNRDTLMYSSLSEAEVMLLSSSAADRLHAVRLGDTIAVPPLAQVFPAGVEGAAPGSIVADNLMLLTTSSLPLVAQLLPQLLGSQQGLEQGLPSIAAELMGRGVNVCGIEAGPGIYRLRSAAAMDYVDRLMGQYLNHVAPSKPEDEESQQEGSSASLNAQYSAALEDTAKLQRVLADFDSVYFGSGAGLSGTGSSHNYKLPSTFYMSAYRRMAADVIR